MNKYVKKVMDSTDGLPITFEEYQRLHPVHAKMVPMAHIQKLRDEFDAKLNPTEKKAFKPINFK